MSKINQPELEGLSQDDLAKKAEYLGRLNDLRDAPRTRETQGEIDWLRLSIAEIQDRLAKIGAQENVRIISGDKLAAAWALTDTVFISFAHMLQLKHAAELAAALERKSKPLVPNIKD